MARRLIKAARTRLNIYVPDPAIRRQVKAAAARHDLSVSDYCLQALAAQLMRDGEGPLRRTSPYSLGPAVEAARRFQAEIFGGRVFAISSADLIREARRARIPR